MALNLGDINFGLGVDTRRLGKSVKDVVNFGASVEAAARRTGKGAKAAAADLQKQERAALNAIQQTLRFNEQLRKAKAPAGMYRDAANSLKDLTNWMTQGRLKTLAYQRVLEKFDADLGRNKRALDRYIQSLKEGATPAERFANRLRNLSSSATLALGPLSGLGSRISALAGIATRADVAMAAMLGGIAAGVVILGRMGQAAIQTSQQLDQVRARFEITSGLTAAGDEFERIRQLSEAAGTEFIVTANSFTRLQAAARGTSMEGAATNQVFEDILFGAARFQVTTDELTGTLRAFEQMMSKGIVQAEELRGQLGDRLVGAFNVAAQAMGVTTQELNEMLRAGDVATSDFLPKFAAAFRAAVGADQINRVESFRATMNRLTNAQTHFSNELDKTFGISKAYQSAVILLTNVLNLLADNMDTVASLAGAISGAMLVIAGPRILAGLTIMVKLIKDATLAMIGLNAATMANPMGALASVLARIGIIAAGAAAGYYMMSSSAQVATTQTGQLISTVGEFIEANRQASITHRQQTQSFIADVQARMAAVKAQMEALRPTIPTDLAFEVDPRSGFQRFMDDLSNRLRIQLGMGDEATQDWLARQEEISRVQAQYDRLAEQLRTLMGIEADYQAQEEARAAAQAAVVSSSVRAAQQTIDRTLEESAATRGLVGEVERLQAMYRDVDAIEQFRKQLVDAEVQQETVTELVERFAGAVAGLREAVAQNAVDDAMKQFDRMGAQFDAILRGPEALEELNRAFEESDAVEDFQRRLIAAGVSMSDVASLTQRFAFWQRMLNEQREEANRIERENKIAESIAAANREMESMQRLLDAFNANGMAGMQEQEGLEAVLRQVEGLRQSLLDAGAAAEDPRVAEVLNQYIALLDGLDRARRQAALDEALTDYATAMDHVNRQIAAARAGAEALANVNAAIAIEEQVEQMRQRLIAAGETTDVAADKARQYGEALATLQELTEGFNTSADTMAEKLQEVQTTLAEAQARATASSLGRDIDRQLRMIQAVAAFTKMLAEAKIEGDAAAQMTREYANALAEIDANEARQQVEGVLETLRDYQRELAAIRQGPDFYKTFTESQDAVDTVIQFRDGLREAGVSISETNRLTRELVRTMNELERQRAANRLHEAFADADKELAILQRRIAAMREGPRALERLDTQLDIDRQVEEFERNLREAATAHELLENAFDLPTTIADTETAADRLRAALERISQLSGLDAGVLELIQSLDTAVARVGTLSSGLTGLNVTPQIPGADFIGPPMPSGSFVPTGTILNPAMDPLMALTGQESHMTTADAGTNMTALLNNQFRLMQQIFGQSVMINDAIAKAGTSRESETPGSQHFHGNALDLNLQGMDNATRIRLVQAALAAGFTGFGFGENILHVDTGARRSWDYGNADFAGRPVAEMQTMVSGAAATATPAPLAPTAVPMTGIPGQEEIDRRVEAYRAGLEAMAAAENSYTQNTALANAQERIDRLNAEIAAYGMNTRAVEALQAQYARQDEIRSFRESLEAAGLAQEVVNQKVREFQALVERRDALQAQISAAREFADVVGAQLNASLDGTAKAFADAIASGEGLSSLADLSRQVASEILAAFLKLYVLKPLLDSIFPGTFGVANVNAAPSMTQGQTTGGGNAMSGMGGILGSITDALAGWFGTIFSRKGNVFSGGLLQDVKMYRKGGILSGPTLFSTASGPAIGGEAGDEAIVPLVRSSSGDLGIRNIGSSGNTTVNFNFPPGTDATSFRKSEAQLAAMASRVASRGAGAA